MGKKDNQSTGTTGGQVFELTMDNPEDQDELNRQLHKPGKLDYNRPAMTGRASQGKSTTESAEKKADAELGR